MNKWIKKTIMLVMGLMMALSLFPAAMTSAAEVRPETGDLIIHKLQYNGPQAPVIENSGLELGAIPDGTKPLQGAEFSIYQVADDAELPVDVSGETAFEVILTGATGIAHFDDLPAGRYYVVETDQPKGVESFSEPFLVDVPMMHPDGKTWNSTVHVYPKNQLVLGAVDLTKWAEEVDGDLLNGAVFSLFKKDGELVAGNLVTQNGKIHVGELEVGEYYFQETAAAAGYGLDQTKIHFEITLEDHAYADGNLVSGKQIKVEMVNYDIPDIEKFVNEAGDKHESADYLEEITWIIKPEIPNNIDKYTSYVVKDTFGAELTYDGELVAKGMKGGAEVNVPFTASGVSVGDEGGTLNINFNPADLVGVSDLRISFKTHLNERAILGVDYENNVVLEMNNGFADYVEEEEEPPAAVTGGKPFMKTNGAGMKLQGAEFVIYRMNGSAKEYLTDAHGWGTKAQARTFVSDANGLFDVKGLAFGDYYLEETKAPKVGDTQYHLLDEDVLFTVDANSYYSDPMAIQSPTEDPTADKAEIVNESPGISLPQTGGIGTLMFTLVGLGLMGSSVKLYKKSSNKEDEENN